MNHSHNIVILVTAYLASMGCVFVGGGIGRNWHKTITIPNIKVK